MVSIPGAGYHIRRQLQTRHLERRYFSDWPGEYIKIICLSVLGAFLLIIFIRLWYYFHRRSQAQQAQAHWQWTQQQARQQQQQHRDQRRHRQQNRWQGNSNNQRRQHHRNTQPNMAVPVLVVPQPAILRMHISSPPPPPPPPPPPVMQPVNLTFLVLNVPEDGNGDHAQSGAMRNSHAQDNSRQPTPAITRVNSGDQYRSRSETDDPPPLYRP
ncbi:hypothetical protein H072_3439 [Dactylellina haptotyla CBS 200.50]|uniref:Uncharacterized protein n=1 Tax=Dactylellina haptotyla (strain CBS 200.50) TaxID=1284197 RepID=S8AHX7_DACHA|nr:hypothetical protein H072_3439 [Dactylellina haptotyla CBS 200.50]